MTGEAVKNEQPFKLSMLLYDTRYRSLTIQTVFFILLFLAIAWLVSNTVQNLAALGKDFSYNFFGVRAGYDINQMLINYSNDDSHARATIIGLLNTLLVAFLGCILATIIGVTAGVLRLSNNWLVARLMTIYVEGFRNIPVLLWILLIFAVMTESMPPPKAFRGDNPSSTLIFDSVAVTNRGIYLPSPVFENSLGSAHIESINFSIHYDYLAIGALLFLGIMFSRMIVKHARSVQERTGRRPSTWWKSLLLIFGPTIALLWHLQCHLDYPALKGFNFTGGLYIRNSLVALWLALSLYTGAFIAEIVRGGILAISKGQSEAAGALGLRPGTAMRLVVLPQAMRVIVPPLISNYLNLTKNSSLAIAVGYMDLRSTLGGVTLQKAGRELECMLLMMAIYLAISLIISAFMNAYNNKIKLKER